MKWISWTAWHWHGLIFVPVFAMKQPGSPIWGQRAVVRTFISLSLSLSHSFCPSLSLSPLSGPAQVAPPHAACWVRPMAVCVHGGEVSGIRAFAVVTGI